MAKRDSLYADGGNYNGGELRGAFETFRDGIIKVDDFKVTSTGAALPGALTSGDGEALIQANQAGLYRPGKYMVADSTAETSSTWERFGGGTGIPQNIATNPRLDAVILLQYDSIGLGDGSGRRDWVRMVVPGVAGAGVALGSALPALPANSLLLAEVLVPANSPASIPAANIRDRRQWAKNEMVFNLGALGAVLEYTITGLDGDADRIWSFEWEAEWTNPSGADRLFVMKPNGIINSRNIRREEYDTTGGGAVGSTQGNVWSDSGMVFGGSHHGYTGYHSGTGRATFASRRTAGANRQAHEAKYMNAPAGGQLSAVTVGGYTITTSSSQPNFTYLMLNFWAVNILSGTIRFKRNPIS